MDPVTAIFYDDRNVAGLYSLIFNEPLLQEQLTEIRDSFEQSMTQAMQRYPGTIQRQFFGSREEFAEAVLDYVELLNEQVVAAEKPKLLAYQQQMNWWLGQELPGLQNLPDTMQLGTETRRSQNQPRLREYHQWD
jgi:hypothetical protein